MEFSALITKKFKYRARFVIEKQLQVSLSTMTSRIDILCPHKQANRFNFF